MEMVTACLWGPFSFWAVYSFLTNRPYRFVLQLIISLGKKLELLKKYNNINSLVQDLVAYPKYNLFFRAAVWSSALLLHRAQRWLRSHRVRTSSLLLVLLRVHECAVGHHTPDTRCGCMETAISSSDTHRQLKGKE